jgi:thiol-disulfide isomerase/thioredoxin
MTLIRLLAAAALFALAGLVHALEMKPYTAETLAAAQQAGRPVVVFFHADWCPTCRQQDKVLSSLKSEGLDVVVLVADYDKEKDLRKRLNVRAQSCSADRWRRHGSPATHRPKGSATR